jgi:hypothetical protein
MQMSYYRAMVFTSFRWISELALVTHTTIAYCHETRCPKMPLVDQRAVGVIAVGSTRVTEARKVTCLVLS